MIDIGKIRPLKGVQDDYGETIALINRFTRLLEIREPFYLTENEFDDILKWKLGKQYGRQARLRLVNTEEVIKQITGTALSIQHDNFDYETEIKVKILCSLRGVAEPVASAILTLVYPKKYAVIDYRVWSQVFGGGKKNYSVNDYIRYLKVVKDMAIKLGWDIQEVDHAIWEYDKRNY